MSDDRKKGRPEPLETFVKVPTFVVNLLTDGDISIRAFALYAVLRSHRNNKSGLAFPYNVTLAIEMGMGETGKSNISRLLNELVGSGAIVRISTPGQRNKYQFPESARKLSIVPTPEEDDYYYSNQEPPEEWEAYEVGT